jgi:hypothetical protein
MARSFLSLARADRAALIAAGLYVASADGLRWSGLERRVFINPGRLRLEDRQRVGRTGR